MAIHWALITYSLAPTISPYQQWILRFMPTSGKIWEEIVQWGRLGHMSPDYRTGKSFVDDRNVLRLDVKTVRSEEAPADLGPASIPRSALSLQVVVEETVVW